MGAADRSPNKTTTNCERNMMHRGGTSQREKWKQNNRQGERDREERHNERHRDREIERERQRGEREREDIPQISTRPSTSTVGEKIDWKKLCDHRRAPAAEYATSSPGVVGTYSIPWEPCTPITVSATQAPTLRFHSSVPDSGSST